MLLTGAVPQAGSWTLQTEAAILHSKRCQIARPDLLEGVVLARSCTSKAFSCIYRESCGQALKVLETCLHRHRLLLACS